MCLSRRLKTLREEYEYTQKDICSKLSISTATLSQYENGVRQPSYDVLKNLADIYNVSTDYLLGRTDIRNFEENTIAAHTDDRTQQLSEDDRKQLDDFIDFLIERAKKNE